MSASLNPAQAEQTVTMKDLNLENPRWCAGCGDYGVLAGFKRFLVEEQLPPHQTVNVSGIGCSGRTPFYINTYGAHAIHGRAIPVALGLVLTRPDLHIFVHSGDGDAMSIGGNHLLHALHKNFNCTFIMYDNELYALTKSQSSPTTRKGHPTNTQPQGTFLDPIVPMKIALGAGVSFAASTADWLPEHLVNTLKAAYAHPGFSFVHVYQRCPHFDPKNFDSKSSSWFSFLTHPKGIPPDKRFADNTQNIEHDPSNLEQAFRYANDRQTYVGLFYADSGKPRYDEMLRRRTEAAPRQSRAGILDSYKI